MAILAKELLDWLTPLVQHDPETVVYIDEDGLALCVWAADESLEVGGEAEGGGSLCVSCGYYPCLESCGACDYPAWSKKVFGG